MLIVLVLPMCALSNWCARRQKLQICVAQLVSGRLCKGDFKQLRYKSYFVTTPIFYVNAPPHIGHLYTAALADATCRWQKLRDNNKAVSKLVSGTDEHGLKVWKAADTQSLDPEAYCNKISQRFKDMCSMFSIDCYEFIRTTEKRHVLAVEHFWNTLKDNGYIYKGEYEGWYSTSDEAFVPLSEVVEVEDYHIHEETRNKVEWTTEVNYKFRLSLFKERLIDWMTQSSCVIFPSAPQQFILSLLDNSCDDLSVSRDRSRVPWGIPVPGDSSQTIYVWLDALVNYLTACGYPDTSSSCFLDMWPVDVHFVGIDIVKFHAIYWPAFLMAAQLELPKKLLVHSHWTIDNVKMSKSKGNIVDPFQASQKFTADGLRYFLLRQGVVECNCNYSETLAYHTINGDLANDIGNCLGRATAKHLNPDQIYPPFHNSVFADSRIGEAHHAGAEDVAFIKLVRDLPVAADEDAKNFHFYKSLSSITTVVRAANMVIHRNTLWKLDQSIEEEKRFMDTMLYCVYEGLRVSGILLQPIVPTLAERLLDRLAVPLHKRTWTDAERSFVALEGDTEDLVGVPLGDTKMFFKRLKIPPS